ncbi:hemolysin family protein [Sporolactobacillus terrae]|uniref:HlyC/CorC family transporter n=1 Tax=Sporolactobacillus terrae TaxID=269673 RepID=A0ABX5Q3V9_9BACL|nr:hemolysin family protein [Sporolactobacillus terrae]QAA21316.1 HlyC/CorC family transporter [Sporolactobacillus terrae]QAA24288.1 HlyC/CorC family transporter [Sporolactobacillus terrae]UAK16092.1 hemolysin family protein [Sporolactobacillus terrae]
MDSPSDDPGSPLFFQFGLIGVLTLINAFFAAAEIALVSLNKKRIERQAAAGNKKALIISKVIDDPSRFLATIQVGITLANFFSSASAATGLANQFASFLGTIPYAKELSIAVITLVLSYITLVFGELFPKRIALQNAERIAAFAARPIFLIGKFTYPFVMFLSFSVNVLAKVIHVGKEDGKEQVNSREEIKLLAQSGQEDGSVNTEELEMIRGVFELDDKIAREIMTARTDSFIIDADTPPDQLTELILSEKYSRIPVYEQDRDRIIGLLNIKDYFHAASKVGFENVALRSVMREAFFVPETRYIDDLLKEMRDSHQHLAVLIDEYGGFAGIVTMEDLIEEIVGEIEDEYDETKQPLTRIDESTYLADGSMELDAFNHHFKTDIDVPEFDTLAGWMLSQIGSIPDEGFKPTVTYKNMLFTVKSVNGNRLEKIGIKFINPASSSAAS